MCDPGKESLFIGVDLQVAGVVHADLALFRKRPKQRYAPDQNVFEHDPVTDQGVRGVLKCCGSIFLEKKVSGPGWSVASDK